MISLERSRVKRRGEVRAVAGQLPGEDAIRIGTIEGQHTVLFWEGVFQAKHVQRPSASGDTLGEVSASARTPGWPERTFPAMTTLTTGSSPGSFLPPLPTTAGSKLAKDGEDVDRGSCASSHCTREPWELAGKRRPACQSAGSGCTGRGRQPIQILRARAAWKRSARLGEAGAEEDSGVSECVCVLPTQTCQPARGRLVCKSTGINGCRGLRDPTLVLSLAY